MKAEIYYLEEQEDLIAGLAEDLRAKLYPALEVESHLIAFSDRREIVDLGRRYVKLLQASLRPETGLQLGIKELDHYGYRFYIYVYHAFAYSASGPLQLQAFFPAIAVRNRMALVPAGLGKMLQWGSSATLGAVLKSFETGGAEVEKNFYDAAERIERGEFDMIALGRALIADPEWPDKIRRGEDTRAYSRDMLTSL